MDHCGLRLETQMAAVGAHAVRVNGEWVRAMWGGMCRRIGNGWGGVVGRAVPKVTHFWVGLHGCFFPRSGAEPHGVAGPPRGQSTVPG